MDKWPIPWEETQPERVLELDRLAQNQSPCGRAIHYVPEHDESGECHGEFVFDAAEVEAIMAQRLVELPNEQHGRYPPILNWLRQRDLTNATTTDVPAAWDRHFLNVAVDLRKQGLGRVTCGKCAEVIPQEQIALEWSPRKNIPNGWAYEQWLCPHRHILLTKDSIHFFARRPD